MSSLFDIGKSGLQSYRQALAVTGQNIANINTDGYKRREANLEEISASQSGITGIANQSGLGVRVEAIRRSFDSYLVDRNRSATAYFESTKTFLQKLEELEDMMLPTDSNIGIVMGKFFNSLQAVAAAPGDIAPRTVALEMGKVLASTFQSTALVVEDVGTGILKQSEIDITSVNILATELASVNQKLLAASGASNNSLLDNRDVIIDEISKLIEVSTEIDSRGVASVRLGKSQNGPLLVGKTNENLMAVTDDLGTLTFSIFSGGKSTTTSQVTNGALKGLSDSYSMTKQTISDLDQMAFVFANSLNTQHNEGLDLKGLKGTDLFISKGFEITPALANLGTISTELTINDIGKVVPQEINLRYSSDTETWTALNKTGQPLGTGKNKINLQGLTINMSGNARNGDEVTVSASAGYAKNLQFTLKSGDQFAAAASSLIFSDINNKSEVELLAEKALQPTENINSIEKVLSNSMSSVGASNFIKNGTIALIPANASAIELASLTQQSQLQFNITDTELKNASTLAIAIDGGSTHSFDVSFATNMPGEAGSWMDISEISSRLNNGSIKNASNQTLKSLGMFASGENGNLTISLATGAFNTNQNSQVFSSTVGNSLASVKSRTAASNLQIFTKEGRHLAGTPFSTDDMAEFLTAKNGFNKGATYRGDYLNGMEGSGYRGMNIERTSIKADQVLSIGGNGSSAQIVTGTDLLPNSPTNAWKLKLNSSSEVTIPAGSSAKFAAETINTDLSGTGINASANTRIELWHDGSGGKVQFQIGSKSTEYANISATISSTNLSTLAENVNQYTNKTGVTAFVSKDKSRVILESSAGEDIKILKFDFDNNSGKTLSSRLADNFSSSIGTTTLLGGTRGGTAGVSTFAMSGAFTNDQTAVFTLEGSTFTYTANGSETAAQARDRLLTNPGAGEFQGSDSEVITVSSSGVLQVADKNGNNLCKIESDGTATGLKVTESNPNGTFAISNMVGNVPPNSVVNSTASVSTTDLDSARYCGQLILRSSDSFTADIDSVSNNSSADLRLSSLISMSPSNTGETTSLRFNSIDGIDTNSSDPNGLDAVAAAGTFTLTLPTSDSGSNFTATVNTKDLKIPTPENVAIAVARQLRSQGPVASLSGITALTTLPEDKDSVSVSYEGLIYNLTLSYANPITKANPEISISGGEAGRLSAYFDSSKRLQIAAPGGSVVGNQLSVSNSTEVADNSDAAKRFGLTTNTTSPTRTLSGVSTSFSTTVGDYPKTLSTTLNGSGVTISLAFNGTNYSLTSSNSALIPTFSDTGNASSTSTTNKIILKTSADTGPLVLPSNASAEGFGLKVSEYKLTLKGDQLDVTSSSSKVLNLSTSATSLAENRVKLINIPNEDLIVLLTGTGSRKIAANYDLNPRSSVSIEEDFSVKVLDDSSSIIEVFDKQTGHSIATRILDETRLAEAIGYKLQLDGKASKGDIFFISPNKNATGDARNLDAILAKQRADAYTTGSGSFQEIFAQIVSKVGSSVNSGKLANGSAEAQMNATNEAEAQFSGISLDAEAANLLEQQQAYQASARILSTARELFDTLLKSV